MAKAIIVDNVIYDVKPESATSVCEGCAFLGKCSLAFLPEYGG